MLTHNENKLLIFENFQIDKNLPKFKKDKKDIKSDVIFGSSEIFSTEEVESEMSSPSSISFGGGDMSFVLEQDGAISVGGTNYNKGFINNIMMYFVKRFFSKNKITKVNGKIKTEKKVVDRYDLIKQFFSSASSSMEELKSYDKVAESYNNALKQSEGTGQTALFEKLKNLIYVIKGETTLIQSGLNKYLSEDMVVDFYKATDKDKALKLSWIKNFTRLIPSNVIEIKKVLDEKEVFDNYVILHFDPNNEAVELTKDEKEKLKDPILFGVIDNSNKLYYVADWMDEVCDLTLEKVIEVLGKGAFEINDKSVNSYFEKQ